MEEQGINMNCDHASLLISQALDGELPGSEEAALLRHLQDCSTCRRFENEQRRLREALAAMLPPQQPEKYAEELRRRIGASVRTARTPGLTLCYRITALAAVFLLSVVVLFLSHKLKGARDTITSLMTKLESRDDKLGQMGLVAPGLPASLAMARTGVAEPIQVFRAVEEYLSGGVRWMAVDGNQVELGMSSLQQAESTGAEPDKPHIIVLTFEYVERRNDGSWRTLSNPQFALLPGEEAAVRLQRTDGSKEAWFRYRVKADLHTEARIRAEVTFKPELSEGEDPSLEVWPVIEAAVTLTEGKPVLLGASGDMSRRYELYVWAVSQPLGAPGDTHFISEGRHL